MISAERPAGHPCLTAFSRSHQARWPTPNRQFLWPAPPAQLQFALLLLQQGEALVNTMNIIGIRNSRRPMVVEAASDYARLPPHTCTPRSCDQTGAASHVPPCAIRCLDSSSTQERFRECPHMKVWEGGLRNVVPPVPSCRHSALTVAVSYASPGRILDTHSHQAT